MPETVAAPLTVMTGNIHKGAAMYVAFEIRAKRGASKPVGLQATS